MKSLRSAAIAAAVVAGAVVPASGLSAARTVHHPKFVIKTAVVPGLGTILTTPAGFTLYVYTGDIQSVSTVPSQTFAAAWPAALLPPGDVLHPSRGVVGLGTLALPSGQVQITWQGLPLYTFIKDTTPHVATGNDIRGFFVAFVKVQKKGAA